MKASDFPRVGITVNKHAMLKVDDKVGKPKPKTLICAEGNLTIELV